jgi:hypothetical protein
MYFVLLYHDGTATVSRIFVKGKEEVNPFFLYVLRFHCNLVKENACAALVADTVKGAFPDTMC